MNNKSSFLNKLLSVLKIFFLFAVCILSSIIIVWPLWKFSTSLPKAYTILILSLIFLFILYSIIKAIIRSKKITVLKIFINLIILAAGIFFTVYFVLFGKRLIALLIFILMLAILIIFNILIKRLSHE